MADRPPMTPADVPQTLVDAAEQALATAYATAVPDTADMTPTEAVRVILAAVMPAHADHLGAELGRLTFACPHHTAPIYDPTCVSCGRYTALLGARRLIEGRDGTAAAVRQLRQDTNPERTIAP